MYTHIYRFTLEPAFAQEREFYVYLSPCTHMYTYIYTHTHTHTRTHTHIHIYICMHIYRFMLEHAFAQEHDFVIVLEDDLEIAPDALRFFTWATRAMHDDPSIFCASGYNDNG